MRLSTKWRGKIFLVLWQDYGLVRFIDKDKRESVYTNFKDELLTAADAEVPVYAAAGALYRRRVTQFIRDHRDHLAIAKLRANHPLTATDLQALEPKPESTTRR
jgi:type I restriction enzyme R subunit